MRHIWSLLAGIVFTPLAWFLIAVGQAEMSRGEVSARVNDNLLLGGLLIIGVGLLLGFIGSLRTSPVGALTASLIFLGASVFALLAPLDALDVFGRSVKVSGYEANLSSPLTTGVLGVVGGMLLMGVFSAARWRGRPVTDRPDDDWGSPAPAEPLRETPAPGESPVAPSADTGTDKTA